MEGWRHRGMCPQACAIQYWNNSPCACCSTEYDVVRLGQPGRTMQNAEWMAAAPCVIGHAIHTAKSAHMEEFMSEV
jgi:hypothetical protein